MKCYNDYLFKEALTVKYETGKFDLFKKVA